MDETTERKKPKPKAAKNNILPKPPRNRMNWVPILPQKGIVGNVVIPPRPNTVVIPPSPRPGTVVLPGPTMMKGPPVDMTSIMLACNELGPSGDIKPTSKEDKEFLERAIFNDFKNIASDMRKALDDLADVEQGEDGKKENHLNALDILIDYVDDIDAANDCVKIGGIYTCFECLKSPFPEIRASACTLIAEIVQNNQEAFNYCENLQVLSWVMDKVESETENVLVKEKGLYAVSCLLRDNNSGIRTFLTDWGLKWIFELALTSTNVNILKKCRYIIHSIYSSDSEDIVKEFLIPKDTIEYCSQLINRCRKSSCVAWRNIIFHIFQSVLTAQKDALIEVFSSAEFGLVHMVNQYIGEYDDVIDPYYSPDSGELYDVLIEFQRALKTRGSELSNLPNHTN